MGRDSGQSVRVGDKIVFVVGQEETTLAGFCVLEIGENITEVVDHGMGDHDVAAFLNGNVADPVCSGDGDDEQKGHGQKKEARSGTLRCLAIGGGDFLLD